MADIERIAMVLSKSSKTVADWKLKFPILQDTMKAKLAAEMEKVTFKIEAIFRISLKVHIMKINLFCFCYLLFIEE